MKRNLTSVVRLPLVLISVCAACGCSSSPAGPALDDAGGSRQGASDGGVPNGADAATDAAAELKTDDAVVDGVTILVRADRVVDPDDATFAQDSFSVDFFAGPTSSAYGVTFPLGRCSNDGSGVQYNSSGPGGKSTGSNAIDLVASGDSGARASLAWNAAVLRYDARWQGSTVSAGPWRAGASLDVVDTDGTPPVQLGRVLELPSQPLEVTLPTRGARVSRDEDLRIEWPASDGLRVDVGIGNVSCAGKDSGSLTVPGGMLASVSSFGAGVTVTRSRVRRFEFDDQVIHVIVTESLIVPVTGP